MGPVRNLHDALDEKYDAFYAGMQRVEFSRCEKGYILESEGGVWDGGEKQVYGRGWYGMEEEVAYF
jgi:hypothetical protein